jgi:cytochrome d ubiquinol oxidase subunit II
MDYAFFQEYWWLLVSLLGALLVFLFFVQGGQTLLYTIGKTEHERSMMINSIGRKWGLTYTTLVTFGGAFFASFPLFYSTSFGGAYWPWMLILMCFILQAVAYELRSRGGNLFGQKTYDAFLLINGFGGLILVGVAVGTLFTGGNFIVDKGNLSNQLMPVVSTWQSSWHGLEAVADPRNLLLGLAIFFLARTLGSLYFINNINDETIDKRARKQVLWNAIPFLICFLAFFIWMMFSKGFAVDPNTGAISLVAGKYFFNFIQMPVIAVIFVIGVVSLLYGIGISALGSSRKGIWCAGIGTVLAVLCLFLILGYNNTAYYPSVSSMYSSSLSDQIQSSLTIRNSSSSPVTLKAMSIVSILIPFVLAYIVYAWYAMDKKKIDKAEVADKDEIKY